MGEICSHLFEETRRNGYCLILITIIMKEESKELLRQILANQVVIFKRLEEIEIKIQGRMRSAPYQSYAKELKKEAEKCIPYLTQ